MVLFAAYQAPLDGFKGKLCGIEVRRFLSVAGISLNANTFPPLVQNKLGSGPFTRLCRD